MVADVSRINVASNPVQLSLTLFVFHVGCFGEEEESWAVGWTLLFG
jgi:hypothetical protein